MLIMSPAEFIRNQGPAGRLCRDLPSHVTNPPVETVVFAWGVNEDGQLGLDRDQNTLMTPKVVEALLGVQFKGRSFLSNPLVGGSRNTLAIDASGEVYSWGWNDRGTLGHGHRAHERKPRRVQALAGKNIVQVHVNGWHCLALSSSGQVYAWGGNEYNQCAVNPELRDVLIPTPCLPQLKVKQVACGGMHSLVLTEGGEVLMWGEPWGDFSLYLDRLPRKVPGANNMAAISAGAFHNMALNHDGQVFTWGTNDFGQLGNGNTSYDIHPRRVVDLDDVPIADIATGGWDVQFVMDGLVPHGGPKPAWPSQVASDGAPAALSRRNSMGGPWSGQASSNKSGRGSANRSGRTSVDRGGNEQQQQQQQQQAIGFPGASYPSLSVSPPAGAPPHLQTFGSPHSPRSPRSPRSPTHASAAVALSEAQQLQHMQLQQQSKWGGPVWPTQGTDMHSMVEEQEHQEDIEEEEKLEAAAAKSEKGGSYQFQDSFGPDQGLEGSNEEGDEQEDGGPKSEEVQVRTLNRQSSL
ncbi:regulator of chromosome condensation 1/beta-lactamase-inhibitor protein II [Dunaliella salina]|uniref:Regulator of chromosome condensation 1/beta-lactamase-inhibitor protein II n=1 Tax=Dunaliella salina TaxID=3046 RepID=A0ABQ7FXB8_DUNSA|nr:regulator of chromosome condensation 1/beta-lactamase-inhibitor protein II [Dunaliella salina]|eukprot:KAF5827001.1 regulator of chromosome condensation 1/beta-lactamase-inhibitor protein II [Dunaliella salina]